MLCGQLHVTMHYPISELKVPELCQETVSCCLRGRAWPPVILCDRLCVWQALQRDRPPSRKSVTLWFILVTTWECYPLPWKWVDFHFAKFNVRLSVMSGIWVNRCPVSNIFQWCLALSTVWGLQEVPYWPILNPVLCWEFSVQPWLCQGVGLGWAVGCSAQKL